MNEEGHYPFEIELIAKHATSISPRALADVYVDVLGTLRLGPIVSIRLASSKWRAGTREELSSELERVGETTHFVGMGFADGTQLTCHRDPAVEAAKQWSVSVSREGPPTESWLQTITKIARAAVTMSGFEVAFLGRHSARGMAFVPSPPLARSFHLVTTTDSQVAERYDDPAVFWQVWTTIERLGETRLCIRHLDALEEEDWLARTFEQTMELARHAKPGLTYYDKDPYWYPPYAPWWEPGDYQDEKAGYPALTLVGYIAESKTVEFTGYITKQPMQEGGEAPRHVLITEIHAVRALVAAKQTEDGRPIEVVRVVFPERWMAEQERRPLLDVGAQVFYLDVTGTLVPVGA
jgi:hypothetical protein